MAGVILVPETLGIGKALEDLELLIGASDAAEFPDRVTFIPLP
ncbi:MAG: hypothetical protein AAFV59_18410 [Pseudomonadota bacterium]